MVADRPISLMEGRGRRVGVAGSVEVKPDEAGRLVVMPAAAPGPAAGGGRRRGWMDDAAELGLRRMAAFLAEAAVLVLVLGLLERLLAAHRVEWGWAVAVVGISAGLLGGSVGLEVLERRRG